MVHITIIGTATNAVGSYYHEFSGFKNIIISSPIATPTISLPTSTGWSKQSDRGIWMQNGYTVTVLCNAKVTTRDGKVLSTQAAVQLVEIPALIEPQTAEQMTEITVEPFVSHAESLTHFNSQSDYYKVTELIFDKLRISDKMVRGVFSS